MTKVVLIVGAGPVGMTIASELARYGVAVRIVDKAAQRTDKSKALVLWSRTLELLDRGGGSAPFVDAGFKAEAVNIIAADKVIGRVSMESAQSPYPYGLMLLQSHNLKPNACLKKGLPAWVSRLSVRWNSYRSRATRTALKPCCGIPTGARTRCRLTGLLGCDGAHSAVRHGLGARFTGETLDSDWMLADVHMTGYPFPDSEVSVYWHRDGAFVIFPISPGRYRVIADLPTVGAEYPPTPTLEQVQTIIDRRGPSGLKAFDPIWLAGFRINDRKVSDYRWGRVFLVGDGLRGEGGFEDPFPPVNSSCPPRDIPLESPHD